MDYHSPRITFARSGLCDMSQMKKISLLVSLAAFGLSVPAPAWAGFLWVAPTEAPAPAPVAESGVVMPSQGFVPQAQSPAPVPTGLLQEPAPVQVPALAPITPVIIEGHDTVVRGFAKNVPLAVALRQILPPGVGFSIDQDVSLGALVSWKGGKPWRDVLKDMVTTAGLTTREDGAMVVVARPKSDAAKAAAVQAQTLPTPLAAVDVPVSGVSAPAVSEVSSVPLPASGVEPALSPAPELQATGGAGAASAKAVVAPVPVSVPPAPPEHVLTLPPSMAAESNIAPSVPVEPVAEIWTANRGDTIRKTLENWSRRAGVEMIWQAEYDYPLQASLTLTGSFEDVTRNLLGGFEEAKPQPIGTLHNGEKAGQAVLVVQARGNSYSE